MKLLRAAVVAGILTVAFCVPFHYALYALLGCFVVVLILLVLHFTQRL